MGWWPPNSIQPPSSSIASQKTTFSHRKSPLQKLPVAPGPHLLPQPLAVNFFQFKNLSEAAVKQLDCQSTEEVKNRSLPTHVLWPMEVPT